MMTSDKGRSGRSRIGSKNNGKGERRMGGNTKRYRRVKWKWKRRGRSGEGKTNGQKRVRNKREKCEG